MTGNFFRVRDPQSEQTLSPNQSSRPILPKISPKKLKRIAALGLTLALPLSLALPCPAFSQGTETTSALDTVVVTASRTEESLREVTGSVTVINEATIEASTANNVAELLSKQGFYVVSTPANSTVAIRGIATGSMDNAAEARVLILINGRRTGIRTTKAIGLANIERVEVIRGPSAVQYGPAAMGGVINIITKQGVDQEFQADLELGFGSYDLHKESASFSGSKGGFDFAASMSNYGRDDYDAKKGTYYYTAIDQLTNANADLGFTFAEKHRLGVTYYYGKSEIDNAGQGFILTNGKYPSVKPTTIINENNTMAFTYDGGTSDDLFTWSAGYSFSEDSRDTYLLKTGEHNGTYTYVDTENFNADLSYNGDILSLTGGVEYIHFDLDESWGGGATFEDQAAYLTGKVRLFDEKLIISAGGRYDKFTREKLEADSAGQSGDFEDSFFAPSVGLAYLPTEWLKLRANYSEGFRPPTVENVTGSGSYAPNPNLKPEKSETFEWGVDFNIDSLSVGVTYFATEWTDQIIGVPLDDGSGFSFQRVNVSGSTLSGIELSFRNDFGPAQGWDFTLSPYTSMTLMTKRKTVDPAMIKTQNGVDVLPNVPKQMINFGIDYDHPGFDLKVNLNGTITNGSFGVDNSGKRHLLVGEKAPPTEYITQGSTTVVDMSLEKGLYTFDEKNRVALVAELNNIFDSENEAYNDYPGPGLNYYVGLKYDFN